MSVLNPDHLFDQAERLASRSSTGPVRQVDLRRAMSAAYYGVFHFILAQVADEVVGVSRRGTPPHTLVYRSVDHRTLRDLCSEVRKPRPQPRYQPYVPSGGFGRVLPDFCANVLELQEDRHTADYDPAVRLTTAETRSAIISARSAVERFGRVDAVQRRAFLTLLAFPPR